MLESGSTQATNGRKRNRSLVGAAEGVRGQIDTFLTAVDRLVEYVEAAHTDERLRLLATRVKRAR